MSSSTDAAPRARGRGRFPEPGGAPAGRAGLLQQRRSRLLGLPMVVPVRRLR